MDVGGYFHVSDWAQVGLLRRGAFGRDDVIVKGDLLYTKLDFGGLHLDAGPFETADESDEHSFEFVERV